ncbi:MAG: reverse transcriptase N-terminal domain-containing protein [Rhizonema sp. PD37]|nr:reverse transcriptase N-terminal domain-containing protein [Rhizonema sp. PD37]
MEKVGLEEIPSNLFRLQRRLFKAVRVGDKRKINSLQRLILRSRSARFLAIRQITQLNQGKKTAGVDGIAKLNFEQRFELEALLRLTAHRWKHQGLKEFPIPKKDGSIRMLKVPTIHDRCWQKLIHYVLIYWSERNSKTYDGLTAELLRKQKHECLSCHQRFLTDEKVHLHHIDGNHNNWERLNLQVVHESCHDYLHMGKRETKRSTAPEQSHSSDSTSDDKNLLEKITERILMLIKMFRTHPLEHAEGTGKKTEKKKSQPS